MDQTGDQSTQQRLPSQTVPPLFKTWANIPPAGRTRRLAFFGFTACFCLFTLLLLVGLNQMHSTRDNIRAIVEQHNVKTELITTMYNLARERTLSLYTMVSLYDPFDRDEEFMRFNGYAGKFVRARLKLLSMDLSAEEKNILKQQGQRTGIAIPLQSQIIELLGKDKTKEAFTLLTRKAVPAQNQVLEQLNKLYELQKRAARQTADLTNLEQDQALFVISIIAVAAYILSFIIAVFVTTRITQAEKNLYLEKELAEVTLHSIGDAVITTDEAGNIHDLNPCAEKLTGWRKDEAIGKPLPNIFNIVDEGTFKSAPNPVEGVLEQNSIINSPSNILLIGHDKTEHAIEHTAAPIMDHDQNIHGVVVVFRDVTEMRSMAYKLSYQASHDSLTGLINRREFEARMEQAIANARAEHQQHALCYLDLDQFKIINDTAGHSAGDELLKQLAHSLPKKLRSIDVLARFGGDEFGILLEGCKPEKALAIADKLRKAVKAERFVWEENSFEVTASIGIVPITSMSGNLSELLSAADRACYAAKDDGRNRIHLYDPNDADTDKLRGEMVWIQRINHALENNHFTLYQQEIFPLNNNPSGPRHFELLIRMQEHNGELIPPMLFIPAAERYNLMPVIDRWVIHDALQFLSSYSINSDLGQTVFAINLSGQSLCESRFLNFVVSEFDKTGVNPEQICFEITETAAIANLSRAIRLITTLKELGCKFALDDFGSGLSSFGYLKNMPVDYLKIDGSFILDICDDPTDLAFVEAINRIGHVLGIQTIAEFVENEAIVVQLKEIGINYGQGYYFCRPAPLDELLIAADKINSQYIS